MTGISISVVEEVFLSVFVDNREKRFYMREVEDRNYELVKSSFFKSL